MRLFFEELGHSQWVDPSSLEWNCTCQWGSTGRYRSGVTSDKPCVCVWKSFIKIGEKEMKRRFILNNIRRDKK